MIFKSDVENYLSKTKKSGSVNLITMLIYFFHPRLTPIGIFRISSFFYRMNIQILAQLFSYINQILFGLEISPKVKIGPGFFMPHCRATVIGAKEIGNNVTIYQNVTIGAKYLDFNYNSDTRPSIGNNVIIGTGATVLGGVKVGEGSRIGPHALVTTDVEPNTKHVLMHNNHISTVCDLKYSKPEIIDFKNMVDDRGVLVAVEAIKDVPFEIKRIYYIYGTKAAVRRGFHAHRNLKQVAIAVNGSCKFLIDNGEVHTHYELNNPAQGLLIDGLLWREMYDFSDDCVLLVLANQYFDENDYVRNYDEFKKMTGSKT
jgi:serine acetyltransferase